ncbi:DUF3096 domain-containing protein [Marinobacter guineae]|nr:DUF3096 domain-containing protein [Marinobacter guineae]
MSDASNANLLEVYSNPSESSTTRESAMTLHLELAPLISLGAGIGILVFPKLLNYIVAGYLIVLGVLGLLGHSF